MNILVYRLDVFPLRPYSPDLALSDFHLFQSLQTSLNNLQFKSEDDVKTHLGQFSTPRTVELRKSVIFNLPDRCKRF